MYDFERHTAQDADRKWLPVDTMCQTHTGFSRSISNANETRVELSPCAVRQSLGPVARVRGLPYLPHEYRAHPIRGKTECGEVDRNPAVSRHTGILRGPNKISRGAAVDTSSEVPPAYFWSGF